MQESRSDERLDDFRAEVRQRLNEIDQRLNGLPGRFHSLEGLIVHIWLMGALLFISAVLIAVVMVFAKS